MAEGKPKPVKAAFAAGCFWHVQLAFSETPGVLKATAGYAGGSIENPSYEDVCTGKTGHVETVEIEFDERKVSYAALLEKFFSMHDPTQTGRQGPDIGSQYNSVIFYYSPEQRREAEEFKAGLVKKGVKVATKILPFKNFFPAEEYHQDYLKKKGLKVCPA